MKEEAIKICQTRFKSSDENVLVSFFKHQQDISGYILAIKKSDASCFRPICKFLRGLTTDPKEKQIEMLAWLTDFKHRPYQKYLKTHLPPTDDACTKSTAAKSSDDHGRNVWRFFLKKSAITGTLMYKRPLTYLTVSLLLLTGGYAVFVAITRQKCMYWDGQRYEVVFCDGSRGNEMTIPFDPVKQLHFKMITRYDTLTEYSVGKVWYVKRKGQFEFYTSNGLHPTNPDLTLKPLTDFILNTAVRQKREQLLLLNGKY